VTTSSGRSRAATPPQRRDGWLIAAAGLAVRLAVVAWAWERVPPIADGTYYDTLARRIGAGLGYTWQWPDGAVTFAAHYPVGYPALVGAGYAVFGAHPGIAMVLGAVLGGASVLAIHRFASADLSRGRAAFAAAWLALDPGLVSYTPALMTEGITAALLALAMWALRSALRAPGRNRRIALLALTGAVLGAAALVRPQAIVLAPLFAVAVPVRPPSARFRAIAARVGVGALVSLAALLVVAPWTARNCVRMNRCALVSVNGGWNLLIGTDVTANGTWAEVRVPAACTTVYDEAAKDACFQREAVRAIARAPMEWIALAPKKLAATFDHVGAGPAYLHASNASAFGPRAKWWGAAAVVVGYRLSLAGALLSACGWAMRVHRSPLGRRVWLGLAAGALILTLQPHAWLAVVALSAIALWLTVRPRRSGDPELPAAIPLAGVILGATALTHAIFFGAGRYGLIVTPALIALAVHVPSPRSMFERSAPDREGF
jgi:hypothetical protein